MRSPALPEPTTQRQEFEATWAGAGTGPVALRNVRVFDGDRLTEPQTVVIDEAIVATPGTRGTEVDAGGATLLPGLIDAHVHLRGVDDLDQLARWGITTGLDMGCWPADRVARLRAGTEGRADLRCAGPAHAHGMFTVIHAASVGAYATAVASGTDIVTHAPVVGRIRDEDVATLAAEGRTSVPTAIMMATIIRTRAGDHADLRDPLASIAALHRAGVPILAGTDANSGPGTPAQIPHGRSLHDELELLVQAGLSTTEALRSATSLPAQHFALTDRGRVKPGQRADLLLFDGNPVADIRATRSIRAVWCAGRLIPTTPAAQNS